MRFSQKTFQKTENVRNNKFAQVKHFSKIEPFLEKCPQKISMLNVMVSCFQIYPVYVLQTNNQTVRYFKVQTVFMTNHIIGHQDSTQSTMNHKLVTIAACSIIILCLIAFFITKQVQVCRKHYSCTFKAKLTLKMCNQMALLGN